MKYIDAELLRKEIEEERKSIEGLFIEGDNNFYDGQDDAYNHTLALIDSLQQEQPFLSDNLELNMTRTKLELDEIETLTHLVRARAVAPGPFQGLYKNILSKLNKMFDEEYADREKKEEEK